MRLFGLTALVLTLTTEMTMAQEAVLGPAPEAPSMGESLIPFLLIVAIGYFLIVRPSMKQAKAQRDMVEELAKGDKALTTGGLLVKIVRKIDDRFFEVEISDGVKVQIRRDKIVEVIEKASTSKSKAKKDVAVKSKETPSKSKKAQEVEAKQAASSKKKTTKTSK